MVDEDESTLEISKNLIMILDNIDIELLDECGDVRTEIAKPEFIPTYFDLNNTFDVRSASHVFSRWSPTIN